MSRHTLWVIARNTSAWVTGLCTGGVIVSALLQIGGWA